MDSTLWESYYVGLRPGKRRFAMRSDKWFRARAKEMYQQDGKIEVDGNARISRGDDEGAYVEAWVWVPLNEEADGS